MKKKNSKIYSNKIITVGLMIAVVLLIIGVGVYGYIKENNERQEVSAKVQELQNENLPIIIDMDEIETEAILEEPEEITNEIVQNNTADNTNQINKASENNIVSNNTYYIKINNSANVVTIYTKDADNNYTVPFKAMVCSTGGATPKSGKYKITTYRREWNGLQGDVYGQYAVQIIGNILFHSVPYTKRNDYSSLEWWEYDKLGTSASLRMY